MLIAVRKNEKKNVEREGLALKNQCRVKMLLSTIIILQAKALTFGSALMVAQRTFGALGFSSVQFNLIHNIVPIVCSRSNEFE